MGDFYGGFCEKMCVFLGVFYGGNEGASQNVSLVGLNKKYVPLPRPSLVGGVYADQTGLVERHRQFGFKPCYPASLLSGCPDPAGLSAKKAHTRRCVPKV